MNVLGALEIAFLFLNSVLNLNFKQCFKWEVSDGGRHSMLKGRGKRAKKHAR